MAAESESVKGTGPGTQTGPSDPQVLFPEMTVCGMKILPWNLGQIADLSPVLIEVRKAIQEEGITVENLFRDWLKFLPRLLPHAPRVISVSTGCSIERARNLKGDEAGLVLTSIVSQNWDYLKNSLSLGLSRFRVV